MRRVLFSAVLCLALACCFCGSAAAYTTPGDLGSWPNRCGPWPADGSDGAQTTTEQELANLCLVWEDGQQAQHTDLSGIDSDLVAQLGQVRDAVKGLTANGTTLDTLHTDLAANTAAVNQLDTDLKAQPGPASQVDLASATMDRLDGYAQSNHTDLWLIVGVIVGLFCFDVVLRKLWP